MRGAEDEVPTETARVAGCGSRAQASKKKPHCNFSQRARDGELNGVGKRAGDQAFAEAPAWKLEIDPREVVRQVVLRSNKCETNNTFARNEEGG